MNSKKYISKLHSLFPYLAFSSVKFLLELLDKKNEGKMESWLKYCQVIDTLQFHKDSVYSRNYLVFMLIRQESSWQVADKRAERK